MGQIANEIALRILKAAKLRFQAVFQKKSIQKKNRKVQ